LQNLTNYQSPTPPTPKPRQQAAAACNGERALPLFLSNAFDDAADSSICDSPSMLSASLHNSPGQLPTRPHWAPKKSSLATNTTHFR
jgi:hypothetical protein